MKLLTTSLFLVLVNAASCGVPEKPPLDEPVEIDETTQNNETQEPINADQNPIEIPDDPVEIDDVAVDCVSDLVTQGGNYYALSAVVTEGQALVEMVHYLAATPTSDPEELVVWTREVPARLTAREFAFETDDTFLDVQRADDAAMYHGTMSGNTEFEGPVTVTCWPADIEFAARYDAAAGGCVDELGNAATNDIGWMVAVRTGFGQCATFEGQLNGEAFGYPTFDFIDLRGADFNAAKLNFADLVGVQFEGADLRQFDFGYSTIEGSIDEHTKLPELAECEIESGASSFSCTR